MAIHSASRPPRGRVPGAPGSQRGILWPLLLIGLLAACAGEEVRPPTTADLATALDDPDPAKRVATLVALRSVTDIPADLRSRIIKAGMDPDESVRYESILTIDAIRRDDDDDCFAMLQHISMSDGSEANRRAARKAMDRIIGGPMAELRNALDDPARRKLISEGGVLWDEGLEGFEGLEEDLIEAAADEVRRGAEEDWVDDALVLTRFGDRGVQAALPILIEAVRSGLEDAHRFRALAVLGDLGPRARPILRELKEVVSGELLSYDLRLAAREAALKIGAGTREPEKVEESGPR